MSGVQQSEAAALAPASQTNQSGDEIPSYYVYNTLPNPKSIRIIELLPGTNSSPVHISVEVTSVDSSPQFEALSYVWRDFGCNCSITCDGARMLVTTIVHDVLLHLRSANQIRPLWVDAISIHQDDLEERAYQVTLMSEVYQQALRIIVWLGASRIRTKDAWNMMLEIERREQELLYKMSSSKESEDSFLATLPRIDSFSPNVSFPSEAPALEGMYSWTSIKNLHDEDICNEIERILSHPWFKRSRCVQEAAYARSLTLHCGDVKFCWETSRMTCLFLREQRGPATLNNAWQNTKTMVLSQDSLRFDINEKGHFSKDLQHLLPATRHSDATDSRNKVYAFLGLSRLENRRFYYEKIYNADRETVQDCESHQCSDETIARLCKNEGAFVPNYTIPFEDLYCIITKRLMHGRGSLTMLSHAAQSPEANRLPPWVPDWREKVEFIVLGRVAKNFQPFPRNGI